MKIKSTVNLKTVSGHMFHAAVIVEQVLYEFDIYCVITSGDDSKHVTDIHHAGDKDADGVLEADELGEALDFRTRMIDRDVLRYDIVPAIKQKLGSDYDVVVEENPRHLHVEYQPKGATRV